MKFALQNGNLEKQDGLGGESKDKLMRISVCTRKG